MAEHYCSFCGTSERVARTLYQGDRAGCYISRTQASQM